MSHSSSVTLFVRAKSRRYVPYANISMELGSPLRGKHRLKAPCESVLWSRSSGSGHELFSMPGSGESGFAKM